MTPDQLLAQIAASQHGCATITQAVRCGLTSGQIRHRLRTGRWMRAGRRVFRISGAPQTWEQELMLGLLQLGDAAVVSVRSAAALHAFEGFERGPVEFTVPRRSGGAKSAWVVHTSLMLPRIDQAVECGFRCTSASRTIIDLARYASSRELERAIDSAVRDGRSSPAFLRRRLSALRGSGRAGVRLLDELMVDSGGHSDLERRFLELVRRAGLPRPRCQRIVRRDGQTVARVDFHFVGTKVIAEVTGQRGHASDAERAKDAQRRNELQAEGYLVLEFTNGTIRRRPTTVIETLHRHVPAASRPTGCR